MGDRIVASMFPRWMDVPFTLEYTAQLGGSLDGMVTELTALREDAIVPVPNHLLRSLGADHVMRCLLRLSYYAAGKPFGKVVIRVS